MYRKWSHIHLPSVHINHRSVLLKTNQKNQSGIIKCERRDIYTEINIAKLNRPPGWCIRHNQAESISEELEAEVVQLQHRPFQSRLQGKQRAPLCIKGTHKDEALHYAQLNAILRIAKLENQIEEPPRKYWCAVCENVCMKKSDSNVNKST